MSELRDYSAGAVVGRFARAIGIVLIFSIAGPLITAALISLIVVGLGAALLQLFLALLELEALRTVISVAVGLLAFVTMLASFLPSVAAGLIFALAAVYGGINMIWMAWLAAAACGLDEHPQVLARRLLSDELAERLGPQRGVLVLRLALGGEGDRLSHIALERQAGKPTRRSDRLPVRPPGPGR